MSCALPTYLPALLHDNHQLPCALPRDAQSLGLTVLRTWAFNDGPQWNSMQPSPGVLDERVLRQVSNHHASITLSQPQPLLHAIMQDEGAACTAACTAGRPTPGGRRAAHGQRPHQVQTRAGAGLCHVEGAHQWHQGHFDAHVRVSIHLNFLFAITTFDNSCQCA